MFAISGKPGDWTISTIGNDFIIKNTKYEDVSLKVNVPSESFKPEEIDTSKMFINQDIFRHNLVIKYDNKTLKPQAYCVGDRKGTAILAAVSIDIPENYKITSIYNRNVRVYSKSFDINHLYFIGNFGITNNKNPKSPIINVTAVNFSSFKVICYTIRYDQTNNRISFNSRRYNFEDIPKEGEKGHIRLDDYVSEYISKGIEVFPLYYPSSPTNLIVSEEENLQPLYNLIQDETKHWRKINNYIIKESVTEDDIDNYISSGFEAITIYFDRKITEEEIDEYTWVSDISVGDKIMDNFKIVYLIDSTGKLFKIKLNNKLVR